VFNEGLEGGEEGFESLLHLLSHAVGVVAHPGEELQLDLGPRGPERLRERHGVGVGEHVVVFGAVDDNVLPDANAVALAEALRAAGAEVKLELFPGVGHNTYGMGEEMEDRLKAFFSTL